MVGAPPRGEIAHDAARRLPRDSLLVRSRLARPSHLPERGRDAVTEVAAAPERERTLSVHGRGVQLFEGGSGRPPLHLHGAGPFWWMPVHDLLAARRRVLLPVHPGFGATEGLDAIETIEDLVFHTLDVLDTLELDRVDVVGLSLGGWLAAELAGGHPNGLGALAPASPPRSA